MRTASEADSASRLAAVLEHPTLLGRVPYLIRWILTSSNSLQENPFLAKPKGSVFFLSLDNDSFRLTGTPRFHA